MVDKPPQSARSWMRKFFVVPILDPIYALRVYPIFLAAVLLWIFLLVKRNIALDGAPKEWRVLEGPSNTSTTNRFGLLWGPKTQYHEHSCQTESTPQGSTLLDIKNWNLVPKCPSKLPVSRFETQKTINTTLNDGHTNSSLSKTEKLPTPPTSSKQPQKPITSITKDLSPLTCFSSNLSSILDELSKAEFLCFLKDFLSSNEAMEILPLHTWVLELTTATS